MENSTEPQMIEERKEVQIDSIEVEDLIKILDGLREEGYAHIEVDDKLEYYHQVFAVKQRPETSEEVEARIAREKLLEQREKEHFEYLRAKHFPHLVLREITGNGQ